jgi:hypothetical protein
MRFELSLLAYDVIREQETKGDPHPTLARGKQWYDPDERRQLATAVQDELEQVGLARGGRPTSEFLDLLYVLERPEVEYYTRCDQQPAFVGARCPFWPQRGAGDRQRRHDVRLPQPPRQCRPRARSAGGPPGW